MKDRFVTCVSLILSVAWLGATGCKPNAGPPSPLPMAQIPVELAKGFHDSGEDVRNLAARVGSAVQTNDYPTAYELVQSLCAAPGLDEKQRLLASRSMLALTSELRNAEAQGDQRAAAALLGYQKSK